MMQATATYQLDLFVNKTIADRFKKFHEENPRLYMLFEMFALQLINSGHKRIGAKMIMERVRWEVWTGTKDDEGYKINNDFIAHYSRLFIKDHPKYQDVFETRILKTP